LREALKENEMSADFERLVGRAVIDEEFRKRLINDPDGTIKDAGFQLTDAELDQIRNAAKQGLSQGNDSVTKQLDAAAGGDW
jgi:Ribosomally synthesized peptide prototyped by Frankia Franean1_4349.